MAILSVLARWLSEPQALFRVALAPSCAVQFGEVLAARWSLAPLAGTLST